MSGISLNDLAANFREAARGYGRAGTAEMPDGPYMSMNDAAEVYARLATTPTPTIPAGMVAENLEAQRQTIEACARVAEGYYNGRGGHPEIRASNAIAAAIRKLSPNDALAAAPKQAEQRGVEEATVARFREAIVTTIGRCEALEDEAAEELVKAPEEHAAGFYRGQKSTAKSLRNHLADLARPITPLNVPTGAVEKEREA